MCESVSVSESVEPFNASSIRESHFAAGSLSSITSTFPAFRGTISWKLEDHKKQKHKVHSGPQIQYSVLKKI